MALARRSINLSTQVLTWHLPANRRMLKPCLSLQIKNLLAKLFCYNNLHPGNNDLINNIIIILHRGGSINV